MAKSSSDGKRRARNLDPRDHTSMSWKPTSGMLCRPEAFSNASDTFLPHAKPLVPFPNLHHPNCSEQTLVTSLASTTPIRASKLHSGTLGQSLKARSMTFQSSHQTLDGTPIPDISREQYKMLAQRVQQSLTRANNRIAMTSSGVSDESTPEWNPPPGWAEPFAAKSTDEIKGRRPAVRSKLTNRKRAQSSSRFGAPERMGGIPRPPKAPEPFQSVDDVRPREDVSGVHERPVSVRYYEGWEEKPMGDVVHMLRELRLR